MAVVLETALEFGFNEVLKAVANQILQTARMKSRLKSLEASLKVIEPMFIESGRLSTVLSRPESETRMFINHLEKGKELVLKCSRIEFWNVYQKFRYSNKLIQFNKELSSFFQIDLQALNANTSMRTLKGVYNIIDKMDQRLASSCVVPRLPEHIVGFSSHLYELKRRLLNDDTQVLVVSGLGGCGKTTLAKMFCHDSRVKGEYGENILYVTVSKQSSLQIVIHKIFDHYHENHLEFPTDDDARNQLESLISRRTRSNKMLLVLDDVWPESESIIQNLQFKIPRYKVLVTSRSLLPSLSATYELGLLNDDDATKLLCCSAFPKDGVPINGTDDLVNEIVKYCKGLPLALTVVGASLRGQPVLKWKTTLMKWSNSQSILKSKKSILLKLKLSVDDLDELPILKECFLDLGSFPEDKRISPTALTDMWVELYNLENDEIYTIENLLDLWSRNLINLVSLRNDASELDGYCNELYVTQHDLLRELAIHLINEEPAEERKRFFIEIYKNEFPTWWIEQIEQPINARFLSISTDKTFSSNWYDLQAPKVEVLTLNVWSKQYTLAEFIKRMDQLKVLSITSYGDYPSQLHNLSSIECLSNLRTIRFKHISVPLSNPSLH